MKTKTISTLASLSLLGLMLTGCATPRDTLPTESSEPKSICEPQQQKTRPEKIRLTLPKDPLRMTVVQRRSKIIPGSNGKIYLHIDDITGGQVLLEIWAHFNVPVVDTVSVKPGDVLDFEVGAQKYYLSVVELRNFLTGDDFGVFEISSERPTVKKQEAEDRDQSEEIEQLLKTMESSDLVFIRNGQESTAAEAAAHLRKKWQNATPKIVSVDNFINKIASASSVTGKPYKVKLPDGTVVEAQEWLRRQLEDRTQEPNP